MKIIQLSDQDNGFEAHLLDNRAFIYVNFECTDILYIDNIESKIDPVDEIIYEIELLSKPSIYKSEMFFN